ncbi:MAG: hypothetical protein AAGD25_09820 [Cyanobacteria bacterium P01_F01_bin.150]
MSHDITIKIVLSGTDMQPGNIRSKEIAEVIESIEDAIAATVISKNPEFRKEDIRIGLKRIHEGSIDLEFSPNRLELTLPATQKIAKSIRDNNFSDIPHASISSLKKISAFTRRHQCNAELATCNGMIESLAILTPDTEIPDTHSISGETTLYGEIMRVGGAEPKIQFRTLSGQIIYCSASKDVVKRAGMKLYTEVGLNGTAAWNSETLEIDTFHVTGISDYQEGSLVEAFEAFRATVQDSFDHVEDVDQLVRKTRYASPEV